MRLPRFDYSAPETLEEALDLLAIHKDDAKILAGGTDLLVRMKKGLLKPKVLISLKALNELSYIKKENEFIKIGAGTPIADIIASDIIQNEAGALFQACEKIGAVTIQHYRGTIGGNILQDNRCHHYNQSDFHRSGRQACHKDGGKICYAREEADRCNSTCQSDGATALMALGAEITLAGKGGEEGVAGKGDGKPLAGKGAERTVALTDFYTTDGIMPFAMESYELLKEITIPVPMSLQGTSVQSTGVQGVKGIGVQGVKGIGVQGAGSAYQRLACRSAIDYPIVCAAVLLKQSDTKKDEIDSARIVVGAMGRSPLFLAQVSSSLRGKKLDDTDAFKKAADSSMNSAATFAVHNVGSTLEYRCDMVSQMVFQALEQAAVVLKG